MAPSTPRGSKDVPEGAPRILPPRGPSIRPLQGGTKTALQDGPLIWCVAALPHARARDHWEIKPP
eukprot:3562440-Pyramimonas_sp.AAC.1